MEALLKRIQLRLQSQETSPQLECWLQDATLAEELDGHLTLLCPNVFSKQWLEGRYKGPLEWAIKEETGRQIALDFRVVEACSAPRHNDNDPPFSSTPVPAAIRPSSGIQGEIGPQSLQGTGPSVLPGSRKKRYELSNFVVGPSNRFAWSAAQEICKDDHSHYNPLLLLASTGLGKTHLGQAIRVCLQEQDPKHRVHYVTAEGYFSEMIQQMRNNAIFSFKQKYRRNCDTLILDDIQFVAGKKALQSDLCHTLDALLQHDKRVVLMGNISAGDTDKLHENFRSRIFSGLVVSMELPDYETRVAILRQLSRSAGLSFPEGTLEGLAGMVRSHVRDLEGALRRAGALQTLLSDSLDPEALVVHFRDLPGSRSGTFTLARIALHVAQHYALPLDALSSRSRHKKVLYPRQVAMYLSRTHTHESLAAIGRQYNRDHASVLYALKSLEKKIARSPVLARELRFIEERLLEGRGRAPYANPPLP